MARAYLNLFNFTKLVYNLQDRLRRGSVSKKGHGAKTVER